MIVDAERLAAWSSLAVDGLDDRDLADGIDAVLHAVNVLDGLAARMLVEADKRGLARALGYPSTASWLSRTGHVDAGVARRRVTTALALSDLPEVAARFRSGDISAGHAEAVVSALASVEEACPDLPEAGREEVLARLVQMAGVATPRQVRDLGQDLLLSLQPDTSAASEDIARNKLDYTVGPDGRGRVTGNFDVLTLEKLRTAIEPLAMPRRGADGSPDRRSASQRRADGFSDVLDGYHNERDGGGAPKPQLTLVAQARDLAGRGRFVHALDSPDPQGEPPTKHQYRELFDTEWPFHLAWTGSVSRQIARMLACDCDVTVVLLDDDRIPLDVGRTERLVSKRLRTALQVRDRGCAMPGCGRPPLWCDAHHCVPWSEGGATSLGNCCLLCRHHHRVIHQGGWEVQIGDDGHPWFTPPASIDPERRPMPAYGR